MKIAINPTYSFLTEFINKLPESFATEGEIIYNERNVLKRYQVQGVDLIVKSFKIPVLVNRVAYAFFRKSKACRSYEYALEILKRGGSTPEPIAYIEEFKGGLLNRSFFISIYNASAVTIRNYMYGGNSDEDKVLRSFTRFTAGIHRAGILHIDYSPGNILMNTASDGTYSFSLIDINRLRFKKISTDEALRNFDRLAVSVDISTRLGEMYADCCSLNREETVRKINEYSDRFFLKRTIKLVAKALKKEKGLFTVLFGPLQRYLYLHRFRTLFLQGRLDGYVYEKERELYLTYIKQSDERHVLNRRGHYE